MLIEDDEAAFYTLTIRRHILLRQSRFWRGTCYTCTALVYIMSISIVRLACMYSCHCSFSVCVFKAWEIVNLGWHHQHDIFHSLILKHIDIWSALYKITMWLMLEFLSQFIFTSHYRVKLTIEIKYLNTSHHSSGISFLTSEIFSHYNHSSVAFFIFLKL